SLAATTMPTISPAVVGCAFAMSESSAGSTNWGPWERDRTPGELWDHAVTRHIRALTEEEKADLSKSDSFRTKKIHDFDRLSLRRLIELSGLSDEAIEYLLVATANQTLQHIASTEFLRE